MAVMATPVVAAKLFYPLRRPNLVVRSRLIERLDAGLHGKLTCVAAPAGFGKTTLIAAWLATSVRPVAWLSLERSDSDPVRFMTYLMAALRTAVPNLAEGVWTALLSPEPPPIDTLLAALVNELTAVAEGLSVVLDDYHVIDSEAVDSAVTFLLDQLPPRTHLVLITRDDPRIPLARLRARGQLSELRAHDLKFNSSEAAEFLHTTARRDLSPEQVAHLESRTEGWIAGLQLAAVSLRTQDDTAGFIASFTGSHRFVLDYLVEEVLQQQTAEVQSFLLHTSVLDRLCGPLCDAVLLEEPGSGQAMLEAVEAANLFVIPLDDERRWYRYHHLFAELLRQRLDQRVKRSAGPSEGLAALHRRASAWFEHHGLRTEAFQHAVASNDVERAESLIASGGLPMHLRGSAAPVLAWLEELPAKSLDERPSLWLLYASTLLICGRTVDSANKLKAAEAAVQGVDVNDANRDLFGRIASLRATMAVIMNDTESLMSHARCALEYLDEGNLADRTAATWALGHAHMLQDDRTAAARAFSEVVALGDTLGESLYTMAATLTLGQLQEGALQFSLAARSFERVVQLAGDPPQSMACEAHLGLARIAYERNDLNLAQEHAQRSVVLARQTQGIDTVASFGVLLARIRLAVDDATGAEAALDDAQAFVQQHGFTTRVVSIAAERVRTLLRQGHLETAAHLATAHELAAAQARVYLAQGNPAAALATLGERFDHAGGCASDYEELEELVLRSVALDALGDEDGAAHGAIEALELAAPGGLIRIFVDQGPRVAHLVREAGARGAEPSHVVKVLAAFGTGQSERLFVASTGARPGYALHEPLSERELDILRLVAEGRSNREIGELRFRALDTIKGHIRRIYGKLEVGSRTEAVARARDIGLL